MTLESQELGGEFAIGSLEDLLHRDGGVVVGDFCRYALEELERAVVGRLEGLGALAWKCSDEEGVGVGQTHHREGDLSSCARDLDDCLAEVELGLARWLGERHEDLRVAPSTLRDHGANLTLRAAVAVLVTQPLKDPLGGVTLLLRCRLIVLEDLVDHSEECSELGSRTLARALLIARGFGVLEHLLQRVMTDLVLPADLALGHLLDQNSSANLRPNLHIAVHPSPVSLVDSLRNQLVSRDCWVWLFSASVLGTQCGCFRSAFTASAGLPG